MRADRSRSDEIIDSDVDLHDSSQRGETRPHGWDILAVIAVGGVLGAEARYGLAQAMPHADAAWPWGTLLTNLLGSALLGVLMVLLGLAARTHRLVRPFVGVGVLGGFTTFSTFAVDAYQLLLAHRPLVALGYLTASVLACLVGVLVAQPVTRAIADRVRR